MYIVIIQGVIIYKSRNRILYKFTIYDMYIVIYNQIMAIYFGGIENKMILFTKIYTYFYIHLLCA